MTTDVNHDDETLVAYLDGELPADERKTLESRLIDDEPLRDRMRTLQQSWDLLAHLPSPTPDDRLVQSTLELVVADLTSGVPPEQFHVRSATARQRPAWLIPLVVLASAVLVAMIARSIASRVRLASQTRDLPVAMDMDAYTVADDLDLIRALAADPFWKRVVPTGNAFDFGALATDQSSTSDESGYLADPVARLATLPADQQSTAASRWDRFRTLEPSAQQRLRETAAKVAEQDDAPELLDTMRAYARWRDQLSRDLIEDIESGDPARRASALTIGVRNTLDSIAEMSGRNLSEEAIVRIQFALEQIARDRIDSGDQRIRAFVSRIRRRGIDETRVLQAVVAAMVLDTSRFSGPNPRGGDGPRPNGPRPDGAWPDGGRRRPEGPGPPGSKMRAGDDRPASLTFGEMDIIYSLLPDSDLDQLQSLASSDWMQAMILRQWATEAVRRSWRGDTQSRGMADRYRNLPSAQRDVVDLLPPEVAIEQLQSE